MPVSVISSLFTQLLLQAGSGVRICVRQITHVADLSALGNYGIFSE